ncbi:MAG: hypothetical protein AUG84_00385 [Chloroflexi bacterium 13_1_20CM_4_66_7]|nr:MAG: hypothetical protein AUG84_00385 [Chloroflexi bacterium 13_1_20CM_4_66_7]
MAAAHGIMAVLSVPKLGTCKGAAAGFQPAPVASDLARMWLPSVQNAYTRPAESTAVTGKMRSYRAPIGP